MTNSYPLRIFTRRKTKENAKSFSKKKRSTEGKEKDVKITQKFDSSRSPPCSCMRNLKHELSLTCWNIFRWQLQRWEYMGSVCLKINEVLKEEGSRAVSGILSSDVSPLDPTAASTITTLVFL